VIILDTNVLIEIRERNEVYLTKLEEVDDTPMMSVISRVELEGGVFRVPSDALARRMALDRLLAFIPTIDFGDDAAKGYGDIIATIGYSRRKLLDRMIAAQALALDATLVTLNPGDFADVPGLKLLAW
jgi:tRNA(fMet)-specific endonuclease VapC